MFVEYVYVHYYISMVQCRIVNAQSCLVKKCVNRTKYIHMYFLPLYFFVK